MLCQTSINESDLALYNSLDNVIVEHVVAAGFSLRISGAHCVTISQAKACGYNKIKAIVR
jgi:hypothetical protein